MIAIEQPKSDNCAEWRVKVDTRSRFLIIPVRHFACCSVAGLAHERELMKDVATAKPVGRDCGFRAGEVPRGGSDWISSEGLWVICFD